MQANVRKNHDIECKPLVINGKNPIRAELEKIIDRIIKKGK